MKNRRSALALACLCMISSPAWSQLNFSTSLADVKYVLTDLDANDGITPELIWNSAETHSKLLLSTSRADTLFDQNVIENGISNSASTDSLQGVKSSTSSEGYAISSSLGILDPSYPYRQGLYAEGENFRVNQFTLTPNTAVTFIGKFKSSTSVSIPADAYQKDLSSGPFYYGYYTDLRAFFFTGPYAFQDSMSLNIEVESNNLELSNGGHRHMDDFDGHVLLDEDYGPALGLQKLIDHEQEMTVTRTNATASSISGTLVYSALFTNSFSRGVVPETGTSIQMLVGLAGLSMLAFHRRRAARV